MTEPDPQASSQVVEAGFAQKGAWVLYDWANSGYGLIFGGPLFTALFIGEMLPQQPTWEQDTSGEVVSGVTLLGMDLRGSVVLALLVSLSALLICVSAPVLGALADIRGWQKQLFTGFAVAGGLLAMTAIFLGEGSNTWIWAAIIYVASFYCFGVSNSFYNAFLPRLTSPSAQGRLSGWGFAVGYVGGAVALIFAVYGLPRLGAWVGSGWMLATGGLWWLLFSLPAFWLLPTIPAVVPATLPEVDSLEEARRRFTPLAPFRQVFHTLGHLRRYRMLFLFLLAFLLYANGIETIIYLSPAFGSDVLGMDTGQLTVMFLIVQFVAFVGALVCGYLADHIGNKPVIVGTLAIWCVGVIGTYFVQTAFQYTLMGCVIGLVLGGAQSSSRALMSHLAPDHIRNEAFGFYAIGNKAVAILGPLMYAFIGFVGGPRIAVFAVLPFLVAGLLLLLPVRERRKTSRNEPHP